MSNKTHSQTSSKDEMNNLKLIRPVKAAELLGVSLPTLFREMKQPDFPNKVRISKRSIGFTKRSLLEFIENRTEKE